jgi:hypothetical protein
MQLVPSGTSDLRRSSMGSILWMRLSSVTVQLIRTGQLQLVIGWAFSTHEPKWANAFREEVFPYLYCEVRVVFPTNSKVFRRCNATSCEPYPFMHPASHNNQFFLPQSTCAWALCQDFHSLQLPLSSIRNTSRRTLRRHVTAAHHTTCPQSQPNVDCKLST